MREARRPASSEAAARAGQAGGLGAAMILGAGVFLLHSVTIHAQKIHMLAFDPLAAVDAGSDPFCQLEIPYQCFNSSAFARLSQAAAAHLDCNLRVQNWRASTCLCGGK